MTSSIVRSFLSWPDELGKGGADIDICVGNGCHKAGSSNP
jgi:hypothetical protein